MTFKKIASLLMAGALTLSLAMPAFATSTDNSVTEDNRLAVARATEFEIEMTGEVYTPVIRVQVLSKGAKMYINPNKGNIEGTATAFGQNETDVSYKLTGLGAASTPILIRSDSDAGLAVNMSATLTAPSGVTFVATAPTTTETDKKLLIGMQGTDGTATGAAKVTDIDSFKALTDDKFSISKKTTVGSGLVDTDGTASCSEICKIAAAKQADGKIIPQYGAVMLAGSSAKAAKWTENDAVSATVVLTFSGLTE